MPPAYVFDLDGTLVDTAPDLLAATNAVLAASGRPPLAPATLRHLVGFGARRLILSAFESSGAPLPEAELPARLDLFLDHYRANIAVHSQPFPDVEETLAGLRPHARLGVLTNKPQEMTDLLMPKIGLDRYFLAIHGVGRLAVAKPDAAVFHHVVADMGGAEGGAIMIGDSATDVATARAAGVPVIAVSYGYTPVPACELGADAVTDDFREIPALARRLLA